jgi:sulfoxide reductase heme-binding subunit YedZ
MQKTSQLFWFLLIGLALLAFYQAFFPVPAVTAFERFFGLAAFFLLCVSLLIGPLMVLWPQRFAAWVEPRRAVGLSAFVFLLGHFLLVGIHFFGGDFSRVFSLFQYGIAFIAFLVFLALALTSSDWAVKKMGGIPWKTLQRLAYLAFLFSLIHFLLDTNGLFVPVNSVVFVNLAELLLLLLALATIVLQFAGYWTKKNRVKKNLIAENG